MFWNGTHWTGEHAPSSPALPKSRRRLRDVLATIPILLLVPALLFPLLSVGAGSLTPTLIASGSVAPGGASTVKGNGFSARSWIDLRWDGVPTGTAIRVDSHNSFTDQITVPVGTTPGAHQISAFAAKNGNGGSTLDPSMLAVVSVEVSSSTPVPSPTASPLAAGVASSTPAPTPTSTSTPTPTSTATATIAAPSILTVSASSVTDSSATITWTVSEAATGQVEYGKTSLYGSLSTAELSYTWSTHVQTLSGLTAGTIYHYRVKSSTLSGVSLTSSDYVFTTLSTIATAAPTPTPTPTPTSSTAPVTATSGLYGPAVAADDLNNSQVGGSTNQQVAYRFRASQSSGLRSINVYIIGATHAGYGAGTGGTLRVGVFADDGTASHLPTGTALATVDVSMSGVDTANKVITWASPATLTAGRIYHVVFTNIDSAPTVNYVSVDGTFSFENDAPWQPTFANADWANLTKQGTGAWTDERGAGRGTITPIADLTYVNGSHQGMGYMETWGRGGSSGYDAADGTSKLRETFTISGGSRTFSGGAIRLARTTGTSALTVRLEDSAGALIEQVAIAAASISTAPKGGANSHGEGQHWYTFSFASSHVLASGATYNLVLSTTAGTEYWTTIIRKGASYGYGAYFHDGHAQIAADGATWLNVEAWGNRSAEGDLQFFLD